MFETGFVIIYRCYIFLRIFLFQWINVHEISAEDEHVFLLINVHFY